jgi:chromosome segregation ATPase
MSDGTPETSDSEQHGRAGGSLRRNGRWRSHNANQDVNATIATETWPTAVPDEPPHNAELLILQDKLRQYREREEVLMAEAVTCAGEKAALESQVTSLRMNLSNTTRSLGTSQLETKRLHSELVNKDETIPALESKLKTTKKYWRTHYNHLPQDRSGEKNTITTFRQRNATRDMIDAIKEREATIKSLNSTIVSRNATISSLNTSLALWRKSYEEY